MSWLPGIPVRSELDSTENFQRIAATIVKGRGSPEGVVGAPVGVVFLREDGIIGGTLYVKEKAQNPTDPFGWASVAGVPDTGWIVPDLEHSWKVKLPAIVGYRRKGDTVRLRGRVEGGSTGTAVFTLPSEFTPPQQFYKDIIMGGVTSGDVVIEPSGTVVVGFASGGTPSFDDVTFTVD